MNYLENHPLISFAVWISSIISAVFLKINFQNHVPPLIMDFMQLVAWSIGIIAGLATINGKIKRYKQKYNENKKH